MTIIDQFIGEYGTYNGISADRLRNQRVAMNHFQDTLGGRTIDQATPEEFEEWLLAKMEAGLAATTVVKCGNFLRPFFKWAWRKGHIEADRYLRLTSVPNPRLGSSFVPKPYSRQEIQELWTRLDTRLPWVENPLWWKRWRNGTSHYRRVGNHFHRAQVEAQTALALFCGLRAHEVYEISLEDLHPDNLYIVVRSGKGGKYREVPYPDAARKRVMRWLDLRAELLLPHQSPWVIVTLNTGTRFQPQSRSAFMQTWRLLDNDFRWHRLRHTCATEWLRAGMPLEKVQQMLGHANINQTLGYAQVASADTLRTANLHMDKFQRALEPASDHEQAA